MNVPGTTAPTSPDPVATGEGPREGAQLVRRYLEAFTAGDWTVVEGLLTEDFRLVGPDSTIEGRAALLAAGEQLLPMMRGHRMLRQWEDGDEVCSVYEFLMESPAATVTSYMTEWNTVRDGRIASGRLLFDTGSWNRLQGHA